MLPIGEWLPDLPELRNPGALTAKNVIPAIGSYRPLPGFAVQGNALLARAQGAVSARGIAGAIANIAGDASKLYKLSSSGASWQDVSRLSGGAYATPTEGRWSFAQFGDLVVACNGIDAPQKFAIGGATNFTALGGSPPVSSFAATVRDFLVMARLAGANQRVQWSGINNAETWSPSQSTQADFQDLPDGGDIMGVTGGENGLVFQERSIKRMTYVGAPLVFQFDEVARGTGTPAPGSIARHGDLAFYLADEGFFALRGAQELRPIGQFKVDRHFWNDVDQSYLHRITAAIDPISKLYVVSYPGAGNGGGTPNRLLIYNWSADRWSNAEVTLEMLHQAATQAGYSLDDLDSVSASLDALPFSLDSRAWSGSGRLLLAGFDTTHRIGYFNGGNLAATVDTTEAQPIPNRRALLRGLRPIVDGGSITVRIASRDRADLPAVFGPPTALAPHGACPVRANGRYHRARIEIAANSAWTHVQGVDEVEVSPAGAR
jgi:hypothetical protein